MRFLFLWAAFVVLTDALPNKPYLLYSNLTDVGAIDLRTHVRTDVIDGLHRVIPLDVDSVDNKLYYGEYVHGNISRSDMDGSNRELIVSDVGLIEGVAVDWVGRSIYWTSYTSEKIMVATLDGKHRKILVNTGLEYPRGLAVDPSAGYLFWTDWGLEAAVERSTLSGGDRVVLVNTNITWPNGITLDYTNKRVYWIDAFHDTITSIDYNGGQRTTIFEDVFLDASKFHGFDLDLIGNNIYWSDWRENGIFALDITIPKIIANISIPSSRLSHGVMGVVIVDPSRQPPGTNPCGSNNGGCQHLCLLEPNAGFKCECEIGTKLHQDGKSCIDAFKDEFLMFADADAAKIYQLQTDEINVEPVPIKFIANLSRPVALEFDPVEDRVYWTDVTRKIICRAFRNGSGYEEIVTENVGVADGLTVDLAGRNLYWTSTTHNTIEVSRFDGSLRRELINTTLDEPRDIIVDPIGGYMYWTDWGTSAKIERAFMDGSNRTELINTGIHWPNGLTIDHVYDKLYWADAWEESIEILELKTGRRNVIINEKYILRGQLYRKRTEVSHPYGLTLLHNYIYWTDWQSDSVYRAQINTGAEITLLANKLGKPMDIHAYNVNPKKQYKTIYTFSFPNSGSNFTCIYRLDRTCPPIDPAPPCPSGYKTSRVNQTCGLYCRNIVGYTWRCPCRNWQECAVRERYFYGCASGYYTSYNVRECVQVVKSGRCPYKHRGSLNTCINDEACPGTEKCCDSKCTEIASIATHPCQKNNGGCKPGQLCFAVPGGHRCDCGNNLVYNETEQECEDALPNKPYLLYSNLTDVGAIDLRTHVRTDVIDGLHRVIPLDVDSVDNKLYYGEYVHGNISRSDMDGSNRELIVSDVGLIEGVAVDWVGRSIYWTSYTSEKIMVATLDGKHRKILVNTGLEYPRGLAVDPSAGYLFWTDWGLEAAVERSTLSGGDRVVLVNTNITWPNGITLDYTNKRVYWIDAFHDTITSIDYNGGQRTTIFEDVFLDASKFHGFDLDLIGNTIYWSDWRKNGIFALDITIPKIIANISIPTSRSIKGVMGVVIVDPSRQPPRYF